MPSNSNKSNENYPKANVITAYSLFGGVIGGGLIGLIVSVFMVLEAILQSDGVSQSVTRSLMLALLVIVICALFGFVLGLIPATLTGWITARLKLYRNDKGLLQSTIIGAISTVIYSLPFMVLSDLVSSFAAYVFVIVIGSASAFITGLLALPKACKSRFDKKDEKEQDNSQGLSYFK